MNSDTSNLVSWDYWMNDWPDESIVWTRANLKDQAPRPLTPLTQDLIQTFEPEGMIKAFSDVFGIVDRAELGRHITGFYGALYLSVPNSAVLGDNTPGSSAHIKFEQFFGLTRAPGWVPPPAKHSSAEEAERKERFEAEIQRVAEIVPGAIEKLYNSVASLRPSGPLAELDGAMLDEWLTGLDALHADCFALLVEGANVASLAYAKAGAALTAAGLDPDGSLLTGLHIGLGGNDSADMGSAVVELARAGEAEPEALAGLIATGGVVTEAANGAGPFIKQYLAFMERYGHRGPGELMLERNSWRAHPSALLGLIARGPGAHVVQTDKKAEAWAELARRSGGAVSEDIAALVTYSQSVMAARENAKSPIVKAFDEVRVLLSAAAPRFLAGGRITATADLLFLSLAELHAALTEASLPDHATFAERRAAFARCLELELPELVESLPEGVLRRPQPEYFEALGFLPPREDGAVAPSAESGVSLLSGIGAAPGIVEGRARIMSDALDDFEPGDILIAETVDPGWSPVLAAAAAVVLDIGGRLSHGAVVARELGVPCVVNTKTAARTFTDGQLVRVDGSSGTVEAV